MDHVKQIHEDTREIEGIYWDDVDGSQLVAGEGGVTKILAYGENAEFCHVSHLAVYKGDEVWQRINAKCVRIVYKLEQSEAA